MISKMRKGRSTFSCANCGTLSLRAVLGGDGDDGGGKDDDEGEDRTWARG